MTKNCKDLENKISLYLDNVLSTADKQAVEEHLKSCPHCTKALADMHKVKAMTGKLPEVEPPAWFKQKIMAKVRAEAQKKSFAEKWFYPLRIKVPVQVFAAIFIVVIAVYIYRAGDEQFKEAMPPAATAPLTQEQKEEPAAGEYKPAEIAAPPAYRKAEDEKVIAGQIVSDKQDNARQLPRKESVTDAETTEIKSRSLQAAMEKDVGSVQMKQEDNILTLKVSDIQIAAGQVEKILAEYSAQKVNKKFVDGKVIVSAEIAREKISNILAQLNEIGTIEGIDPLQVSGKADIFMVIEIIGE